MFWDTTDFSMKSVNAEWEVNQQEWEKFKCHAQDLANDGGYVALRRAAEDRDGWTVETKNVKNLYSRRLYWWEGATIAKK